MNRIRQRDAALVPGRLPGRDHSAASRVSKRAQERDLPGIASEQGARGVRPCDRPCGSPAVTVLVWTGVGADTFLLVAGLAWFCVLHPDQKHAGQRHVPKPSHVGAGPLLQCARPRRCYPGSAIATTSLAPPQIRSSPGPGQESRHATHRRRSSFPRVRAPAAPSAPSAPETPPSRLLHSPVGKNRINVSSFSYVLSFRDGSTTGAPKSLHIALIHHVVIPARTGSRRLPPYQAAR
jgi:hypothetical protein